MHWDAVSGWIQVSQGLICNIYIEALKPLPDILKWFDDEVVSRSSWSSTIYIVNEIENNLNVYVCLLSQGRKISC